MNHCEVKARNIQIFIFSIDLGDRFLILNDPAACGLCLLLIPAG